MQMLQIYHHYRHYYNNVCLFCVVKVRRPEISSHKITRSQIFIWFCIHWMHHCVDIFIPLHKQMPSINDLVPTMVWLMLRTDLTVVSVGFLEVLDEQVPSNETKGGSIWMEIPFIHLKLHVSKHSSTIKLVLVPK